VNDRVDLALAGGADGVHVGDEDLPPEAARRLLPPGAILGVTVRDLRGALAAHAAGADYVGLGPVFPTATKQLDFPPLGLARIAEISRASPVPVVAISGIGASNIRQVAAAGAHCAAVLSDLYRGDVEARARALAEAFVSGDQPA
jgi:thiamine-phosphate pyrophosphorylase